MDNNVNHVEIIDNTVYNISGWGSHNNSPSYITMTGNTFFNIGSCFNLVRWVNDGTRPENGGQDITGMNVQNNIFFTISAKQSANSYSDRNVNFPNSNIQERISAVGIIDNNYYHLPNKLGFSYLQETALSFAGWKSVTGFEKNGKLIPVIPSYHINNLVSKNLYPKGQFTDNISGVNSLPSATKYILEWDKTGKITGSGSLKVSFTTPPSSPRDYVLLNAPIGAVSSAKNYILRFSTLSTVENGIVRVCFKKTELSG